MNRIMLDLETYATGPDAMVLSLGACFFNEEEVGDGIYLVLSREDQWGKREINADTMKWWDQQSDKAKEVLTAPQTPVKNALNCFTQFIELFADNPKDVEMWGNGSDFDNVILGTLYRDFEVERPWKYSNNRCYRTLKNICLAHDSHDLPEREGTHHNALDDAIYQAAMAGRYLKGKLK